MSSDSGSENSQGSEADSDGTLGSSVDSNLISAREAAQQGVLKRVGEKDSGSRISAEPLFDNLSAQERPVQSWAPGLDEKLDQAHRFDLIGRIFKPVTNFLRRAMGSRLSREDRTDGGDGDSDHEAQHESQRKPHS
ncbi:MAG: hypothetical protein H8E43_00120 [Planctomycetia bacterium]|nr:hypothetical protein [Planctomycetia bacterium]MBL6914710.1 hypothetical protein [Planctomycetota bacterium]HCW44103.1 hypothetical protein [Planctomycetota bacterium]